MVAADVDADAPALARRALLEQRLVINATGPRTLRFLPPLVVGEAEIDDALGPPRRPPRLRRQSPAELDFCLWKGSSAVSG